jgi:hypothetical protein
MKLSDIIKNQYIVIDTELAYPYSHDLSNNEIVCSKVISDTELAYPSDIESASIVKVISENGASDLGDDNKVRVLELVDVDGYVFAAYAPEWWM